MKHYLGIDVGGTAIKYALMDEEAQIIEKGEFETPKTNLDDFAEGIGQIYDHYKDKIEGIAMSVPGRVDAKSGYMYTGGAIQYNYNVEMTTILSRRCPVKISLDNDGKCAAMAELWKGSLQNIEHGVVLTLGTGIGGGIIANGKLLRGHHLAAGELSLLPTTILEGQEMNFWANINATSGLTRHFETRKGLPAKSISGKDFFKALEENDLDAKEVLEIFSRNFANGLFAIQAVLDTQRVAIGGGISAQDALIESIQSKVDDFFKKYQGIPQQKMEIVRCAFGNDSNLIGALYNHLHG